MSMQGLGTPTIAEVQKAVCEIARVTLDEMKSADRVHRIAHPRQKAMMLAHEMCQKSLPQIGRAFGDRDHTTVLYASRKWRHQSAIDVGVREELETYRARIASLIAARAVIPVVQPKAAEASSSDWIPASPEWRPERPKAPKRVRLRGHPTLAQLRDAEAWLKLGGERAA